MSRIGIMGGTFDPIHHGHLVAASEAAHEFRLDEVIFVPTGTPVLKQNQNVTNSEHRYLMSVIATASNPKFSVSRVDIDRDKITYTIDTLRDLRQVYSDDELFFISGADAISQIMHWKESDQLFNYASFIAVTRPGYKISLDDKSSKKICTMEIPAMAISSTDIRCRAHNLEPIWYLVPDGVVQYINKHSLYK